MDVRNIFVYNLLTISDAIFLSGESNLIAVLLKIFWNIVVVVNIFFIVSP